MPAAVSMYLSENLERYLFFSLNLYWLLTCAECEVTQAARALIAL